MAIALVDSIQIEMCANQSILLIIQNGFMTRVKDGYYANHTVLKTAFQTY